MNRKTILAIIALIKLGILAYGIYYVNDYYHAGDTAKNYMNGTSTVNVIKTGSGMLLDGPGNDTALIFYPGAKVEYTSYLPLLTRLAEENIDCFLVEMPFNLAILNQNAADDIMKSNTYNHYYISGHSLGGTMASSYVNSTNRTDALILLESYPTGTIQKPVLSIYGTEDKVLNMEKYNESKSLMNNLTEIIIRGANHAQVGDYGNQSGDGIAKITPEKQQTLTSDAIIDFIKKSQ